MFFPRGIGQRARGTGSRRIDMDINERARQTIRSLPKTVHGGQAWKLDNIEDYSHNLNPFGAPTFLDEIVSSSVSSVWHYPDDASLGFRTAVANEFDVEPENVIAGAGSSDIIRMFPNTFLEPGDRVLMFTPSFAEYTQQCKICGVGIEYIRLREENDYRIDIEELSEKLTSDVKALYICNPNNPTGRVEPRDKILSIVDECEEKGIMVFLDETLLELVDGYKDVSCASYVGEYTNLLVAGSLTKSFAIPGIRIGFGISNVDIIDQLNKVRMTWNIGAIEQAVGERLIAEHMDYVHDAAALLRKEADNMFDELKDMGFPVNAPCDGFFYFCDISSLGMDAGTFVSKMKSHGYMVRDCSSFGPDFTNCVRFCVKDNETNAGFLAAMRKVLE